MSQINSENASGDSAGWKGDGRKQAGSLWEEGTPRDLQTGDVFGGRQGGDRMLFGRPYPKGGFADYVLEGFAGPHDYLDGWYWTNINGNNPAYTGFAKGFGYAVSTVNLAVAAPFVAASATPPYLVPVATFNYNRRR